MTETRDPQADLRTRWLPSPDQIAAGVARLHTLSASRRGSHYALVPLAQPGKQYGLWQTGQPVEPVPGLWLAENTTEPSPHPYRDAHVAAIRAASRWLRDRGLDGTVAVAVIDADGEAAIFEYPMAEG